MRFVFDTNVLVEYLRAGEGDSIAADALFKATEIGSVYISLLSLMELWLPDKTSFNIRDEQRIQNIVSGLDKSKITEELLDDLYANGYDLLSQPLVQIRSPGKKWRVEWIEEQEQVDVRLDPNGVLTIFPYQRNKGEIIREIRRLREFPGIQIIPCSARAQEWALEILEHHFPTLGQKREQNSLIDSMIIATGITRRAYLVTNEIRKWGRISQENRERHLPFPTLHVISPEQLVQEF